MRKHFTMFQEDLEKILDASKPVPAMWGNGGAKLFPTPQENANRAWAELGKKMGFNYLTVAPTGEGDRFFTAEQDLKLWAASQGHSPKASGGE